MYPLHDRKLREMAALADELDATMAIVNLMFTHVAQTGSGTPSSTSPTSTATRSRPARTRPSNTRPATAATSSACRGPTRASRPGLSPQGQRWSPSRPMRAAWSSPGPSTSPLQPSPETSSHMGVRHDHRPLSLALPRISREKPYAFQLRSSDGRPPGPQRLCRYLPGRPDRECQTTRRSSWRRPRPTADPSLT